MAATDLGNRLTEAHRLAQLQIATETVDAMGVVWSQLDPAQLDATMTDWLDLALTVIKNERQASAELAAEYMRLYRQIELGVIDPTFNPVPVVDVLDELLSTSMRVTGPVVVKQHIAAGDPVAVAMDAGNAASAGAAVRHSLNGGRETIWGNADRQTVGYARVTSGNPCAFCAMLAGRGAVYRSEDSASFQPHDRCACMPEEVLLGVDATNSDLQQRFSDLYDESTQGKSGKAAIRAFRNAYDTQLA